MNPIERYFNRQRKNNKLQISKNEENYHINNRNKNICIEKVNQEINNYIILYGDNKTEIISNSPKFNINEDSFDLFYNELKSLLEIDNDNYNKILFNTYDKEFKIISNNNNNKVKNIIPNENLN